MQESIRQLTCRLERWVMGRSSKIDHGSGQPGDMPHSDGLRLLANFHALHRCYRRRFAAIDHYSPTFGRRDEAAAGAEALPGFIGSRSPSASRERARI